MAVNPLSRFKPLAAPIARPGHCFLCRSINGPFIDPGLSIQWEGAVIICTNCIIEMHRQLGLESKINQEEFDLARAAARIDGIREGTEKTLEAIRDFVDARSIAVASGISDDSVANSLEDADRVSEVDGSDESSDRNARVDDKSGSEPASQQGPDDLSITTGTGKLPSL